MYIKLDAQRKYADEKHKVGFETINFWSNDRTDFLETVTYDQMIRMFFLFNIKKDSDAPYPSKVLN
jgi:hypothetical protein